MPNHGQITMEFVIYLVLEWKKKLVPHVCPNLTSIILNIKFQEISYDFMKM